MVRLFVKAILHQYLANIYQHEMNINFIIIFLCWFFWWFCNIARIFVQYNMNTGRMFPFGHWLLEQYCVSFPAIFENFPLRGMQRICQSNIEAVLLQQSVAKRQHSFSVVIYCTNMLAILHSHQKNQHKNIILKLIFLSGREILAQYYCNIAITWIAATLLHDSIHV